MKLTKEQFVRETSNLIQLQNTLCRMTDELDIHESVFDRWFENYFNLVEDMCEMDEAAFDNWDGSPLDYWVFLDRSNDTRRGYRKERYDEEVLQGQELFRSERDR